MTRARFIGPIDRLLYLRTLPNLRGVAIHRLAAIAQAARESFFSAGDALLSEGRTAHEIHVLVSGEVEILRGGERLFVAGPGDRVGLLAALAGEEFSVTARARTEVVALSFGLDVVMDVFEEDFTVLLNTLRLLASNLRRLLEKVADGTRRAPMEANSESLPVRSGELDVVERLLVLRRGELFRRMGLEASALMATSMVRERFEPGQQIWGHGDPADHLFVLVEGDVHCTFAEGGGGFVAGPGYPLGNLELFAREPRWFTAVAGENPVVVLRGDHETFLDVLEDDFDVAYEFVSEMARANLRALVELAAGTGLRREQLQDFFPA